MVLFWSKTQSRRSKDYAFIPPDGGWGWVIVFAAFYCQLVIDGIHLTFGMILKEMTESYNTDYSSIALIGSILYGMHYLCGPICAGLSELWGDRIVCAVGAMLSAICLSVAYFTPSLLVLYLVTGCLGGIGLGFVNMTSIVVTTVYFSYLRMLAIGIVVCGTGVGTMVFAAVSNHVTKTLNWQAVCLIEGVLSLTMVGAALIFRPLLPVRVHADPTVAPGQVVIDNEDDSDAEDDGSALTCKTYVLATSRLGLEETRSTHSEYVDNTNQVLEDIAVLTAAHERKGWTCTASCCPCLRSQTHRVLNINPGMAARLHTADPTHGIRKIFIDDDAKGPADCSAHCLKTLSAMLNFSILKSPTFIAYCVAVSLSASALVIVVFYEKVRILQDKGRTLDDAMYYIIWIGFCNMTWRLVLGYISTIPGVSFSALNISGLLLGGVATMASGLNNNMYYAYTCAALYGLASGMFYWALKPIITIRITQGYTLINCSKMDAVTKETSTVSCSKFK